MTTQRVLQRMENRVGQLITGFRSYVESFERSRLFTGPSLYFHLRTLERLKQHSAPSVAITDDTFLESVYATLTAWGMHRMGPGGAKLVNFTKFKDGFLAQQSAIRDVESTLLRDIKGDDVATVGQRIWDIVSSLTVGVGQTKIVSGSKALHHVLPDLVPPIDREYTLRFFYGHKALSRGDEESFFEMFPCLHRIAVSCRNEVDSSLGTGMNTSATKIIDNAIVGYVLAKLKP
jgi:hypothetical protein